MGHHHSTDKIGIAFFLNLCFTLIEIVGGFYTNSVAILSDALHDLGDSLSLGLAWVLEKKADRKGDKKFSFGYRRFSLLSALINGVILLGGSVVILYKAIPRLLEPAEPNANGMIWLAVGGVIVNGIAAYKLTGGKTQNERIVRWHMLEDVLGWVAVLIVAIVLKFKNWYLLDPILSLIITSYVLFNVFKNVYGTMRIFLQGVPQEINIEALTNEINKFDNVKSLHHVHIWSQDGDAHVLSAHVVIDENSSKEAMLALKKKIKNYIVGFGIKHITLELEFEEEECEMEKDQTI